MLDFFRAILGLPVVASEHGDRVDWFIIYIHLLMGFLFVIWVAYFAYVLWRFRSRRSAKADYRGARTHASTYLELLVAGVEAVLLIGFAIPLWAQIVDQAPDDSEANVVRVMAQQFGWNFMYPGPDGEFGRQDFDLIAQDNPFGRDMEDPAGQDDFLTFNDLRIPVGEPSKFHISSLDVIHSFKIIALRVCQDAIPGLSIPTWCIPQKTGRYQINCAQLCGNGHYQMVQGFMRVEEREDFDAWVAERIAPAQTAEAGLFE